MEIDLRRLIPVIIRRLWIMILVAVVFGVGGYVYTVLEVEPVYTSSVTMYVYNRTINSFDSDEKFSASDLNASQRLVETYLVIINSGTVMNKVAEKVNLGYTSGQIRSMFSASSVNDTEVISYSITCPNPDHAQKIAQAISEVAPPEIIQIVKAGDVSIMDPASYPGASYSPKKENARTAALVGFALTFIIVCLVEILDRRIKTEQDLMIFDDIPVIGVIPAIVEIKESKNEGYKYGYGA